jgi:hypothetical protein
MARELAAVISLPSCDVGADEPELRQAVERLRDSGYAIRDDIDLAAAAGRRADYLRWVDALARHLGKPPAMLVRRD